MASTNSNKGRAVVLSAACVTMFFISSIALYSVVSKNLLAVYPEWSSALTWAFPVFQTIMAVTGIFAGRISDKIGPRNVVIAAAVCYGVGWFMSGTVTEPWQFYLWFSLVAAIGNGLGYNPALTTGQKWFIDKKGLASGITLAASTAGPAVLSPVLASLLIPSLGIFGALKALGVIFFVTIAASALFLKAPEAGWLPEGFEAPKGGAHAGTWRPHPGEMVKTLRFWVLIVTFAFAATAGTLLVGKVASIAVQLFADPTSAAAVAPAAWSFRQHLRQPGRPSVLWPDHRQARLHKSLLISLVVTIVALVIMSMSFTQSMFFVALALLGFSFGALLVIYPPSPVAPLAPATSASTTASCFVMPLPPDQPAHHRRAVSRRGRQRRLPAVLLRRHCDRRHRRRAHRLHDGLRQQEEVRLVLPMRQRDSPFVASHRSPVLRSRNV
ncbi:MAG: MFS transporter [Collinsella sp.]